MLKRVVISIFVFLLANGAILIFTSLKFPVYQVQKAIRDGGEYVLTDKVRVENVVNGAPAEKAGIRKNDEIVSINGTLVTDVDKFVQLISGTNGRAAKLKVIRNNNEFTLEITPAFSPIYNSYIIGVEVTNQQLQQIPIVKLLPNTVLHTFQGAYDPVPGIRTGKQSLLGFLYGMFLLVTGVGILNLKKWGLIAYFVLGLSYIVTFFGMPFLMYQSRLSFSNNLSSLIP